MRLMASAIVLCCSSVAMATVTQITSFSPAGPYGRSENPRVDGAALICFDPNIAGSRVSLIMGGLRPRQTYGVAIYATGNTGREADYVDPLGLRTSWYGVGGYFASLPTFDLGPNPVIEIFVWDGGWEWESIMTVTEAEVRAIGTPR